MKVILSGQLLSFILFMFRAQFTVLAMKIQTCNAENLARNNNVFWCLNKNPKTAFTRYRFTL